MFERFTSQARSVVTHAQHVARELGHPSIGTQHLLLAILDEPGGAGARALGTLGVEAHVVRDDVRRLDRERAAFSDEDVDALRTVGIDLDEVRRSVEEAFGPGALERDATCRRGPTRGHVPFTRGAKKALELSLREALRLGHRHIGTEHLLLGLVRDDRCTAARILSGRGADLDRVSGAVVAEISAGGDAPGRTA